MREIEVRVSMEIDGQKYGARIGYDLDAPMDDAMFGSFFTRTIREHVKSHSKPVLPFVGAPSNGED
jgi:hypothetical protein